MFKVYFYSGDELVTIAHSRSMAELMDFADDMLESTQNEIDYYEMTFRDIIEVPICNARIVSKKELREIKRGRSTL